MGVLLYRVYDKLTQVLSSLEESLIDYVVLIYQLFGDVIKLNA